MKTVFSGIFISFLLLFPSVAQQSPSGELAYKIKQEAFQNSQVNELSLWMTDFLGPRLASSKLWERSETLTKEKLAEMGFANPRIEYAMDFPKGGWDNLKTYAAMTVPYYCNFMALPKAWSGSTDGLVRGEALLLQVDSVEDLQKYKGQLAGKIVLMPVVTTYQLSFDPFAARYTDEELAELAKDPRPTERRFRFRGAAWELQQQIQAFLAEEKPAVVVSGSGVFNTPRSTGVTYKYGDAEPVAELVLPIEDHGRMARLIEKGIPVTMEIDIKNEFNENLVINNVIAEIPGTDPKLKNEVVMIGAHLDSWHGGTGAADNASGCVVMMEALRILKAIDVQPRRTIRIALWGGEEQGLYGSRGYMQNELYDMENKKPKNGFDKFALYLNMDNGSGKFRGVYLEENDMAVPYFELWMKPFEALGFTTLTMRKTGATDHVTFDRLGLPAFQFIQDELEYGRGYHTPMDTYERLEIKDLQHNAAVTAWLVLCAAMDNGKIPNKPVPMPPPNR